MVPIGAIGVVIWALSRRKGGQRQAQGTDVGLLPIVALIYSVFVGIALLVALFDPDDPGAWSFLAVTLLPLLIFVGVRKTLALLLDRVLVAKGMVRASSDLGWLGWPGHARGGMAIAAAKALCHQSPPRPKDKGLVAGLISLVSPLRAPGIVAQALLCNASGEQEQARRLMLSLSYLDPKGVPRRASRMANEWLAADAAGRGDWSEVASIASVPWRRRSPETTFLACAAARLLGSTRHSNAALISRWMRAPRRRSTLPLLKRALDVAPSPGRHPSEPSPAIHLPDGSAERRARALHAAVLSLRDRDIGPAHIQGLGVLWDAALGDVARRDPRVAAALRDGIVEDVVAMARQARQPIDPASPILVRARWLLRDRVLADIEAVSTAIHARAVQGKQLVAIDEWREYLALRAIYEEAASIGGDELRRMAFSKVHADACKLACWLFNKRGQRTIANGIFRWLLAEAERVGTQADVDLQKKNVACGSR